MGTPASIKDKDPPQTLAMEDEPLDSRISDTTRTAKLKADAPHRPFFSRF
jgi:hypothetical protein